MLHLVVCSNLDRAIADLAQHMPPGPATSVLEPWHIMVARSSAQRVISQRLSHVLGASTPERPSGVSANVQLVLPVWLNEYIQGGRIEHNPWAIDAMAWKLMALPTQGGIGRWRLARRVAEQLEQSQLWRPEVVLDWLGKVGATTPRPDAPTPLLSADLAAMMGYLRTQCDQPTLVEYAQAFITKIRDAQPSLDQAISRPMMLFGVHSLSALQLSVLAAYAKHHDVYWWITSPLTAITKRIFDNLPSPDEVPMDATRTFMVRDPRSALDLSAFAHTVMNRANARAAIEGLTGIGAVAGLVGATVRYEEESHQPTTVLAKVQASICQDAPQAPLARDHHDANGPSIVRVACSRPQRQVEALRDYLLNTFMDDPTLEPRDVVVACPDPHAWEASIRRVFAPSPWRANLRVRLIDPGAKIPNPVMDVLERVLMVVDGQLTRIQLMDLLALSPVAAKFGFDEQAIDDLTAYLEATHMTWGLDPKDRERFGLPAYHGGTLQDSIDQLALGLTRLDGGLDDLPALGIKAGHVPVIGQFFAAAKIISETIRQARVPQDMATGWVPLLSELIESVCWVDFDHAWQLSSVLRALKRLGEYAADGPGDITSRECLEIIRQTYRSSARRGDVAAGDLVITSLAHARGLHHKVVCLLGMDEGRVPRPRTRVTVNEWGPERVGDRDAAATDRQGWLDLLAGTAQRLAVFWSAPPQGGDAHPSVMVTDLTRTLEEIGANALPEQRVRQGALHRWSVPDHLERPSPDRRASELAKINFEGQEGAGGIDRLSSLAIANPVLPDVLSVSDLIRFGQDPLHAYARHTLGIGWLGNEQETQDVVINASAAGLNRWKVQDQALRSDLPAEVIVARAIRAGVLPIRQLVGASEQELAELVEQRNGVVTKANVANTKMVLAPLEVPVTTKSGRTYLIVDRLPVHRRDDGTYALVNVTASSYKSRANWEMWVRLLVLSNAFPGYPLDTAYICRAKGAFKVLTFSPFSVQDAKTYLTQLIETVELGLSTPLVAPLATTLAWMRKPKDKRQVGVIRKAWEGSSFGFDTPDAAAGSVVRLIGGNLPAQWVLDQRLSDPGRAQDGLRHLDVVGEGIWAPVLAHCDRKQHLEWKQW